MSQIRSIVGLPLDQVSSAMHDVLHNMDCMLIAFAHARESYTIRPRPSSVSPKPIPET